MNLDPFVLDKQFEYFTIKNYPETSLILQIYIGKFAARVKLTAYNVFLWNDVS